MQKSKIVSLVAFFIFFLAASLCRSQHESKRGRSDNQKDELKCYGLYGGLFFDGAFWNIYD